MSARYASLSEVLSADPAIIANYVGGAVAHAIGAAHNLMVCALEEELREREPINCERDASKFLKALIGHQSSEMLIVLFLDARRRLIDYELAAMGKADTVECDLRQIVFRAIARGAHGIIVAHNHPSGDPRPSSSDISVSLRLADTARGVGIVVVDHLVVAGGAVRSAMYVG